MGKSSMSNHNKNINNKIILCITVFVFTAYYTVNAYGVIAFTYTFSATFLTLNTFIDTIEIVLTNALLSKV